MEQLPVEVLPPNLHTLSLNANLFKALPASLATLKDLTWLYLRANCIKRLEVPEFKSANLEMVDLSDNSIDSIVYLGSSNTSLRIKELNLAGK